MMSQDTQREMPLSVADEDGTIRNVMSIASNEDHVGNLIAEGHVAEKDRWREVARLYKGQLAAKQRQLVDCQRRLRATEAVSA